MYKRILIILSLSCLLQAYAGNIVNINHDVGRLFAPAGGYPTQIYIDYFHSLPSTVCTLVSTPPPTSETDLYITYPGSSFSSGDAGAIRSYLENGGRVMLLGDWGGYSDYSNTALELLGSSMRFDGNLLDGGGHQNSQPGQVLSHDYMSGVNVLNYAAASSVSGGIPLFVASDLVSPIISYERVGDGILFALGDTNFAEDLNYGTCDNRRMHENFLTIPEPASASLLALVCGGFVFIRRHFLIG